jgi:oligoendopeptidase F
MQTSRRDLLAAAGALAASAALPARAAMPKAVSEMAAARAAAGPPVTWDLKDLYPSPEAWTADRAAVQAMLPTLLSYKGKLGTSAATLRAALQGASDAGRKLQRLSLYAGLIADSDTSVASAQERRQLSIALGGQLSEAVAYMQPEILAIGADKVAAFQKADPGLANFAFQLRDILRKAPFTLGPEGEEVIAQASTPLAGAQQIRTQLVDSDMPWPEVTLSDGKTLRLDQAAYTAARETPNREDRKRVFDAFFKTFDDYKTSLAAALATQVQADIFNAKAHRHASALEGALSDNGNVPVGVYKTLVDEANKGLPVLHRYCEVRRKMLGLPDLHYYDMYPPLVKSEETYDLARIRALTLDAVAPLGQAYVDTLAKATASPWGDYLPRKNKVSGAYENDAYGVHPYLLLNLTGNYNSLSTFAHEWGHAMHSILADAAQPYETAGYMIFTAEIASTMNEQLLADHMLAGAKTKQEKLFYLGQLLELYRGTFYRQAQFAEFELAIHEAIEKGQALSGERMNAMYLAILKKYHGPKVTIDPGMASEWAYVPHFYYDFYVYQYATCISASAYFFEQIKAGGAKARDNYLGVLKAGGSDYPVDVLKKAGLDMTTPAPYRALVDRFAKTLDQVEALL